MKHDLLILESDKEVARQRIIELEAAIVALGPEFYDVFNQTTETWHDNAPFEAVRDKQTLLATELHNLKQIMRESLPSIPKQKKGIVGIGSRVQVRNMGTNKSHTYFIAGDWTAHAGHTVNGAVTMSRKSPLAQELTGKKVGDEIIFRSPLIIENIEQ